MTFCAFFFEKPPVYRENPPKKQQKILYKKYTICYTILPVLPAVAGGEKEKRGTEWDERQFFTGPVSAAPGEGCQPAEGRVGAGDQSGSPEPL